MNRSALIVAVLAGMLGFFLLVLYVRRIQDEATGGPPVEVLGVRRDAVVGEPVTEELLLIRSIPAAYLDERHVLASDTQQILGASVASHVRATQVLLWTDLATEGRERSTLAGRVPEGMRAIAIDHGDENDFGGLLIPGDRVDLLLTRPRLGEHTTMVTVPLLQNLLVLSVGGSIGSSHDVHPARHRGEVSLLVTLEQASLLTHAQQNGHLRLVLRNENDLDILAASRETDDQDILKQEERARRQSRFVIERVD